MLPSVLIHFATPETIRGGSSRHVCNANTERPDTFAVTLQTWREDPPLEKAVQNVLDGHDPIAH